jgi:hypothetical protein
MQVSIIGIKMPQVRIILLFKSGWLNSEEPKSQLHELREFYCLVLQFE